ncbi:NAD(P)-binding domain-containing protein [bacterium]|nr:NAD(P)-binding domain-containing protein [bacterium]
MALTSKIMDILNSGTNNPRPLVNANLESNVKGLYIIGDLAGAPVIKLAMEHGYRVIETIASKRDVGKADGEIKDVVIIGMGAAGINAALEAKERGLSYVGIEKGRIANTVDQFPEGKWIYAEPDKVPPKGKLWLDGATKEDLLARWHQIIRENELEVNLGEGVETVERRGDFFEITTDQQTYKARYVVLATGQRGNPRHLDVPGEEMEPVYHRLYAPKHYQGEKILVVGGGNSAIEAALTLMEQNEVTLSYRGDAFDRVFKDNKRQLEAAVADGKIEIVLNSHVVEFREGQYDLVVKKDGREEKSTRRFDHAFVLIGADLPVAFLKKMGVLLEGTWMPKRFAFLGLMFLICYFIYGVKAPIWPFNVDFIDQPQEHQIMEQTATHWMDIPGTVVFNEAATFQAIRQYDGEFNYNEPVTLKVHPGDSPPSDLKIAPDTELPRIVYTTNDPINLKEFLTFSFHGRTFSPSFMYSLLYCLVMTVFGAMAMKRWGFDLKDKYQIARFGSLLFFQWFFFFILPEFVFHDWRAYGLVYAWPLFFNTFFDSPTMFYIAWGIVLAGVLIPVFVLFHGKRYCTWICGCGGLAETLGDRWRHYAPKGKASQKWEKMGDVVLILAAGITIAYFFSNTATVLKPGVATARKIYSLGVDLWLVGIIPVTLYPFLGGKVWCRYWCPLAKMMEWLSRFYTKMGWSRFHIYSNDKCITCGECTRYCQVGIDVMNFAVKQETLDNSNSSCIGCGICVTVCPMDTLSFVKPQLEDHTIIPPNEIHEEQPITFAS